MAPLIPAFSGKRERLLVKNWMSKPADAVADNLDDEDPQDQQSKDQ